MPLQATSGAASYDAFGGGVAAVPNYIEDVFSTYLFTGASAAQTITNNIDLSGKGGLVWMKSRSAPTNNYLADTVRGANQILFSDDTSNQLNFTNVITAFSSTGFTAGDTIGTQNMASWTFRKAPKFFDVVTYTGNSTSGRTIAHNLGSVPGCIIVKCTSDATAWAVYHRSLGGTKWVRLNTTDASVSNSTIWNNTDPTATEFTVGNAGTTNQSTQTYVAYLFAHDAGGFGLTGTDNVISCGSYTGNGSATGPTVTLGYEPQWVLVKRTDSTSNWTLSDNMRGQPVDGATAILYPNLSDAEASATTAVSPTATGFQVKTAGATYNASGGTYIYIAIRRGPMKVPTSGTSVFAPVSYSGTSGTNFISSGFTVDAEIVGPRTTVRSWKSAFASRLTGTARYLTSSSTAIEQTDGPSEQFAVNNGVLRNGTGMNSTADTPLLTYMLQRAPSFFDEVCYTGTGSNTTFTHNLGAVPEMMIFKRRDTTANWRVYHSSQPASDLGTLNSNIYFQTDSNVLNSTAPTSSVFTVGTNAQTNASGGTYVAYLFATTAGVSKVGSYTGTGTTLQINCGFTGGSRFVLIKRVDDSADWYVWDSARGIVAGNDSYLLLNSTAAEVTNTDYIDTYSAGFEISSTAPAAINANGGSFVFFAVA